MVTTFATEEEKQIAAKEGPWLVEMLSAAADLSDMPYSTDEEFQIASKPGMWRAEMLHHAREAAAGASSFDPASPGPIGRTTPAQGTSQA